MCRALKKMATIVAVNSFTLLALSLERYFAICHPLRSRRWQTLSHAYKIILGGWLSALFFTLPVAIFQQLRTMRNGNKLCIEIWPDKTLGKVYQIFLDIILFLLPLMMMMVAYSLIAKTLSVNFDKDLALPTQQGMSICHFNLNL
uniref:G-protein coupled receptors family 1 profile domain-containing protein n=1 Tax=Octopus bimaculoides TaxID=37653 RepID=A0A0L8GIT5_OCTBM